MTELAYQARLLRARIKQAFAEVPYPGDENICDGSPWDDDYQDVIRDFTGKHWRDLIPKRKPPQGRVNPLLKDMIFCSAAAWHFFLPAYLITDLMRGNIDPFPFEPDRAERRRDRIEGRFSRLNAEQCAVVASFLSYADALLDEGVDKTPQHLKFFERERQLLAPVLAYWNSRASWVAEAEAAWP